MALQQQVAQLQAGWACLTLYLAALVRDTMLVDSECSRAIAAGGTSAGASSHRAQREREREREP